jgi:5-carboxymethyl-2-hydroxymuconate isomerase
MTTKQPVGAIEQRLMKKENWSMADSVAPRQALAFNFRIHR